MNVRQGAIQSAPCWWVVENPNRPRHQSGAKENVQGLRLSPLAYSSVRWLPRRPMAIGGLQYRQQLAVLFSA